MTSGMDLIAAIREERAEPPSGIRTLELDRTHRWITHLEPGSVDLEWQVEDRYLNLEGAVICSWTTALADQALFFASNSICADGEATRMSELHLRTIHNITGGAVTIRARILERAGQRMFGQCDLFLEDGRLAAQVTATIDVI